jgi:hypothetical protein
MRQLAIALSPTGISGFDSKTNRFTTVWTALDPDRPGRKTVA